MAIVKLETIKYSVNGDGVIRISEKEVPFDTKYDLISPKTGVQKRFHFEHSTGPEFDPKTEWVYKSEDGFYFHLCNDAEMTRIAADAYLQAKTLQHKQK